MNTKNLF